MRIEYLRSVGAARPDRVRPAAELYRSRDVDIASAAEPGDRLAQFSVGLLHKRGQGCRANILEAREWG